MSPIFNPGGPKSADPESTTMSPPISPSSTPPTPLTALTIPSPAPRGDYKHQTQVLRPQLTKEEDEEASVEVKKATIDEIVHPASIPLPPSPKLKEHLPFRNPRISNPLNRVVSDTSSPRSSSGRRVSSALQYALHPHPTPDTDRVAFGISPDSSIDLDLAYYEQMRNEVLSSSSDLDQDEYNEGIEEVNGPSWDSSLGFGGQVPNLIGAGEGFMPDPNEDEAWMGYVRAQLNTLFPDYFDPNAEEQGEEGEEGDISVSTISSNDLITPPGRLGLGRGVPNVRSEIGGLSEEIARLRGVVSGLAEGMRASQTAPEVGGLTGIDVGQSVDPKGVSGGHGIPTEFLKTAHISMDIIRLVHTSLGGVTGSDIEAFTEENLTRIKQHFQGLQDDIGTG